MFETTVVASAEAAPAVTSNLFINVPETTLPGDIVVPAFRVGQFLCSKNADGLAVVTAEGTPWTGINYHEAREACTQAGMGLLTETQALAIAWNAAGVDANWTKGKVGEGKLFRGLRKGTVSSAQPGNYASTDLKERRWLALSNGERICDINGNAYTWIFDDVQGDEKGLPKIIKADSLSLKAPYPPMEKGMGWRPDGERDGSGLALIRGGCWYSVSYAGVFHLCYDWPDYRYDYVGFRSTLPTVSGPGSSGAA